MDNSQSPQGTASSEPLLQQDNPNLVSTTSLPTPTKNVGFGFALFNSLFVVIIIFFTQFLSAVISGVMVNFSPNAHNPIVKSFGSVNLWSDPVLASQSFLGYIYLFISTFFILKFPSFGKYFVIFLIIGLLLGSAPLLYMFAFGGFVVPILILDTLIPPSYLLFYRRKVIEFSSRSFRKYYVVLIIITLLLHTIASIAQLVRATTAINNANKIFLTEPEINIENK